MHRGFLRQWRKELESEVFTDRDPMLYKVWSWCKMKANWQAKPFRGTIIQPGQFIMSVTRAAETFGISRQSTIRILDRLEEMGSIVRKSNNHWTTITLCNWGTYEDLDTKNGELSDNQRTTTGTTSGQPLVQPADTTKESKKEIKEEGKPKTPASPPFDPLAVLFPNSLNTAEFKAAWSTWVAHRVEIKKKLTPTSVRLQLKHLEKIGVVRAIASIEYTVAKGWEGLREEDGGRNGAAKPGYFTEEEIAAGAKPRPMTPQECLDMNEAHWKTLGPPTAKDIEHRERERAKVAQWYAEGCP